MNAFSIVLFIHVLSAIALFVAIALEGVVLARMRSARSQNELSSSVQASRRLGAIYGPAFLGILIAGIYLAYQLHINAAWVPVALLATLLMGAISGAVTGRSMSRLRKALERQTAPFTSLSTQARANSLLASYGFRAGLAVGIVFLMSTTPTLLPSILAVVIGSVLGVWIALAAGRASAAPGKAAEAGTRS